MNFSKIYHWLKYKLQGKQLPSYFYKRDHIPGSHPNFYVDMAVQEYKGLIYLEEEALSLRGKWKSVFEHPERPLDLEIGCGNGFFYEHLVSIQPERNHLGIEYKYKPLVQTIRRIKKRGLKNGRGIRFNAKYLTDIFKPQEINNVYIHFPDPWPKQKHSENRLVRADFLNTLFKIQKSGSFLNFKTDSESYFDFVSEEIKKTPYRQSRYSRHLHQSKWSGENFMTAFEKIFTAKGQPTFYMRLEK